MTRTSTHIKKKERQRHKAYGSSSACEDNHGTPPKKINGAGMNKDMTVTGIFGSPSNHHNALLMNVGQLVPCSPRKQQSSPRCKCSAGIAKPHYDPLAAQNAQRAAELLAQYAAHRKASTLDLGDTSKTPRMPQDSIDDEINSMRANQVCRQRSAVAAQAITLREPKQLEGP
jgi:hypothetical protein